MDYNYGSIAIEDFIAFTDSMMIAQEGLKEVKNGILHVLDVIAEKFKELAIRIQYKVRELKSKKIEKISIPSAIVRDLSKYENAMNKYMTSVMAAVKDGNTTAYSEDTLSNLEDDCKDIGTEISTKMSNLEKDDDPKISYVEVSLSNDTFGLKQVLAMNKLVTEAKNKARKGELPTYVVNHIKSCYSRVSFYNTNMYKGAKAGAKMKRKEEKQKQKANKK